MYQRATISILFIVLLISHQASGQADPDTIAVNNGIIVEKTLSEITLYDYGQTQMKMKFVKTESSIGNLYESIISLATPANLFKDPETTIRLSLDQTRNFINKLHQLLKIDSIKDARTSKTLSTGSKTIDEGTAIWTEDKQYSFIVANGQGGSIFFNLKSETGGSNFVESTIKGYLLSDVAGVINSNYFTVNNYEEYRERVSRGVRNFRRLVRSAQEDKNTISETNETGVRGQVVNFEPIIEEGYKVLKTGVHNTENTDILAEVSLERTPRRVLLSEYSGKFNGYNIVKDEQLNLYVEEELDYTVFLDELLSLLTRYEASGILDPNIIKNENSIIAEFYIIK